MAWDRVSPVSADYHHHRADRERLEKGEKEMLWNIIRDWFVQYVFGGITSTGENYSALIGFGPVYSKNGDMFDTNRYTDTWGFLIPNSGGVDENLGNAIGTAMPLGDWLSTTATIITLVAMCVALFFVVKWLFKMFAGMISGVGR